MTGKVNYNRYSPGMRDIFYIMVTAVLIDLIIVYVFYKNLWICLAAMPVCLYISYRTYINNMISKRKKTLECEFEELLSCLSSLLSAGYSLENAIFEAKKELLLIYDSNAIIIGELNLMCRGIEMNRPVEMLFRELAVKSGISDIITFAEMISISKRSGGDMVAIARQTIDVIHSRHEVNNEITTMIAAKKYENKIMNLMPVAIIVFMSVFSKGYLDILYNNLFGICVMSGCLLIYGSSWLIGNRIMNIDLYSDMVISKEGIHDSCKRNQTVNSMWLYRFVMAAGLKKALYGIKSKCVTLYGDKAESMFCKWFHKLCNTMLAVVPACAALSVYVYLYANESIMYILIITIAVIIGVPYMMVSRLNNKLKRRNKQLVLDYPEMVNRFILLLGSGINMRGAWDRMCSDYLIKKKQNGKVRYIYEEMIQTGNDMARGIPEAEAYERFGRRLQLLPYMKLSAMLSQNLKKGNKRLIEQLRLTSIDALVQRRETMKQLGEEASSKLLLPMMLQFMLILIIVMVPAIRAM